MVPPHRLLDPLRARPWLVIFLVSLVVRLIFFVAMLNQIDSASLLVNTPDTTSYISAADAIRNHWNFDTHGVIVFGPGYPIVLALMQMFTGGNGILLILINIVLSGLGSTLLYLWVRKVVADHRIAIVAALLNVFSITSISLANILLSETAFFLLLVAGLLLFHTANTSGRPLTYVLSGVLLAAAISVRSMGQFLVLLLPLMAWLDNSGPRLVRKRLMWSLLTCGIILIPLLTWSGQFYRKYGTFSPTLAGPWGIKHLVCNVHASIEGISQAESRNWFDRAVTERIDAGSDLYRGFCDVTREQFGTMLRECPGMVIVTYLKMLNGNMHNEESLFDVQVPRWAGDYAAVKTFNAKKGLNYRVSLLVVIGAVIMIRRQMARPMIVLVLLYAYFAVIAGFSNWQTSRIFYPAEVGWAALVAFPLVVLFDSLRGLVSLRLSRRTL